MDVAREQKILNRMPLHAYGDTRDLGKMAEFLVGDGAALHHRTGFCRGWRRTGFRLLRGASLQFFGSFARVPDKGTEFRWHNGGTIMAIFEKTIRNKNFDKLLRKLENEIPDSSWSADLEAGSDFKEGDARCSVRVFERYSMMGGNRLSLTLTMFQNADSPIRLSAITAGRQSGGVLQGEHPRRRIFFGRCKGPAERNFGGVKCFTLGFVCCSVSCFPSCSLWFWA